MPWIARMAEALHVSSRISSRPPPANEEGSSLDTLPCWGNQKKTKN